jgi:hypothetical protein
MIHDLACDNAVGAVVATDCLRPRTVASKVTPANCPACDRQGSARPIRPAGQAVHESATPQSQRLEHNAQFMNLVDSATRRAS